MELPNPEESVDTTIRPVTSLENVPPLPEQDTSKCFQYLCQLQPTVKVMVDNGSVVYLCTACARAYPRLYPFLNFTMEELPK